MATLRFKDMSFGVVMLNIICGCYFSILLFIHLIIPECLDVLCTECNGTATYVWWSMYLQFVATFARA